MVEIEHTMDRYKISRCDVTDLGNCLYDDRKKKYFADFSKGWPVFSRKAKDMFIFDDDEIAIAWKLAYRFAWSKYGRFYVYGIDGSMAKKLKR